MASPVRTTATRDPSDRGRDCVARQPSVGRRPAEERLVIVSNRLPYSVIERDDQIEVRPSSGGLATALRRVHARTNGLWIGSTGSAELPAVSESEITRRLAGERLATVCLSELEITGFYRRYSNGILWPSFHGIEPPTPSDRCGWGMYRAVNERFADVVASRWRTGDVLWIHDYQLMLLPKMLRERLPSARIGFFLHTPLPPTCDLDAVSEWPDLAAGLLGADVLGFQTHRDARHFAEWVGADAGEDGLMGSVTQMGRSIRLMACPIGVDAAFFDARSRQPTVVARRAALRASCPGPLFVGVDRLDYTKGIPERLQAFERLLLAEPDLHGRARFIQVTVPSREDVRGYRALRLHIETLVERINATQATPAWTPVEYVYASIDVDTLVALYGAADIMVVTPKRDGMNLVAKEFVAARADGGGTLVLSETAGAAAELRAAMLVDPTDVASIESGYRRALRMSSREARARMRRLRIAVGSRDVFAWADHLLGALRQPTPADHTS